MCYRSSLRRSEQCFRTFSCLYAQSNAFYRFLRRRKILLLFIQMPRIWLDYCQFLVDQGKITRTRRVFDRSIRALPITQHNRIWPLYIKFVTSYSEISETAMRVYKRYLKVRRKPSPNDSMDFSR